MSLELVSTQLLPPHNAWPEGQLLAQALFEPQPYVHDMDCGAVQPPLPLQRAAVVAMLLVQLAALPHEVELVG